VLVSKFPFDNGHFGAAGRPNRFDVVVFKYPVEPQKGQTPMNYIKRLCGLPGEWIAIFNGDLYVCDTIDDPSVTHSRPSDPKDLWQKEYMYSNDDASVRAFQAGDFHILRKTPDLILAMRRIVYDNDHQAKDLIEKKAKPRWQDRGGWAANDPVAPKVFRVNGEDDQAHWLRYQHLLFNRSNVYPLGAVADPPPELIRNFLGYNTGERAEPSGAHQGDQSWVGDLSLDCAATVEAAQGELTLELSKGPDRFQARFDLEAGTVSLWRLTGGQATELAKPVPAIAKPGTYKLRFANVDSRLTVWVDEKLPFQDADHKEGGIDYAPWLPKSTNDPYDPSADANNRDPASVGTSRAAKLSVAHLQLWRDSYYTTAGDSRSFGSTDLRTMYVQPGHFLCLGDNSSESSDSRYWGLVPQRLLLGRALVVYYPFSRIELIR
jgi:signal peptidase I